MNNGNIFRKRTTTEHISQKLSTKYPVEFSGSDAAETEKYLRNCPCCLRNVKSFSAVKSNRQLNRVLRTLFMLNSIVS